MAAKEPILIVSSNPKIFRPKPKRVTKKCNLYQYNKKCTYNKIPKQKNIRKDFNHDNKKNYIIKNYLFEEKNKVHSFNLDFISLEEMENDFKEFKSKSEELEVQNELINLMFNADNEFCCDNYKNIKKKEKIERPKKPSCKLINNYE